MIRKLAVMLLVPAALAAQAGGPALPRAQVQPDTLTWTAGGNGIQTAIVLGDPTKPGIYVQRLRFAKGTRIMPHMHPDDRVAVLLSGSFYFGYGDTFDEQGLAHVAAGTTWTEPAGTAHFAWARDEDVVVQIVGHGPSGSAPAKQ
jgi:quercetin dioxygenase-like cupin family protein